MSKVAKFEDGRNINEEIKDQFQQKGEEMNEEQEEKKGFIQKVKEMNKMNIVKIGLGIVGLAGIGFGIYKILTTERTENVILDTDWQEAETVINPEA